MDWINDIYCPPMDCRLLKENGLPKFEGSRMSYVNARNDGFLWSVDSNSTIYIPGIFQHAPSYNNSVHWCLKPRLFIKWIWLVVGLFEFLWDSYHRIVLASSQRYLVPGTKMLITHSDCYFTSNWQARTSVKGLLLLDRSIVRQRRPLAEKFISRLLLNSCLVVSY